MEGGGQRCSTVLSSTEYLANPNLMLNGFYFVVLSGGLKIELKAVSDCFDVFIIVVCGVVWFGWLYELSLKYILSR